MDKQWKGLWIQDSEFDGIQPLNLLRKEMGSIPSENEHPQNLRNRHMFVRKTFELEQVNRKAYLDITADDYYKLYINGKFVGQGPAQGYFFHYYFNRIDVTDYVQPGRNVIAVHLYYQGLVNRAFNSGDLRQGMIAELMIGEQTVLTTNGTWRFAETKEYGGPNTETTGYQTQFLEHIDSRLSIPGWRELDFDDSGWMPASVRRNTDYSFVEQPTPPLSVYTVKPGQVRRLDEGHYIVDFDKECTGRFMMRALGESGETIEVRCGEELNNDGLTVRFDMRCNCIYRECWTLSGGTDELNFYDYRSFRYVEIIGREASIDADSFALEMRHYPLSPTACVFETADPLLQGIWDICSRGVQNCAQESYLDCPSREKGQYLGDNTVIGHAHLYLSGDVRMFKKAIRDFAISGSICSGLMGVAPGHLMQEIADFSCQWPMQLLTYYRHSGDIAFVKEMLPVAKGVIAYFDKYRRSDGLLAGVTEKWNLVDWPDNLRDNYDFPLTRPVSDGCHNVINAFYYGCIKAVQELQEIVGDPYEDRLPAIKQAFCDVFFRPDAGLFADAERSNHHSLHANVIPLLVDLVPGDSVEPIVDLIRDKRFSCGVYMSYFVLKALAAAGSYELIYELITNDSEQSWSNMLAEGATACFEAWGKEQKWNTSLCHAWASSPIPVLIEDVIGLKPAEPGWGKVALESHIPVQMPDFRLGFEVPTGRIEAVWEQDQLNVTLPDGVDILRR